MAPNSNFNFFPVEAVGEACQRDGGMSSHLCPPSPITSLPRRVATLLLNRPKPAHEPGELRGHIQRRAEVSLVHFITYLFGSPPPDSSLQTTMIRCILTHRSKHFIFVADVCLTWPLPTRARADKA